MQWGMVTVGHGDTVGHDDTIEQRNMAQSHSKQRSYQHTAQWHRIEQNCEHLTMSLRAETLIGYLRGPR